MKKIMNALLVIVWILALAGIVLPLIPNLEPITEFLSGIKYYLIAGFLVLTLIGIALMVFAKYRQEVNDDEKVLRLKDGKKIPTPKEREQLFADLQLAEFTLDGEEKAGAKPGEALTRKRMLRETLVVATLSKKEQKKIEKQQAKADQKAARAKNKGVYLINNMPRQDLVPVKNRKNSWLVWLLLIVFYCVMAYGYSALVTANPSVQPNVTGIHVYIYMAVPAVALLLFLIIFIVSLVKRKNVLPAFGVLVLAYTLLIRYGVYLCNEFGYFDLSNIMGMLTNVPYLLFNVGFLGTVIMLIIFICHYAKSKYKYLTHEELRKQEEKLIAKEQAVADKLAAKEAKKAAKEQAEEDARLAKEAKAAEEAAAKEAAEKEAEEKAEQERLAAEQAAAEEAAKAEVVEEPAVEVSEEVVEETVEEAVEETVEEAVEEAVEETVEETVEVDPEEEARLAAEKAEQERIAQEKEAKHQALLAEIARLNAEENARRAAKEEARRAAKEAAEKAKKPAKLIKLKPAAKNKVQLWDGLDVNVAGGWTSYMEQEKEKQYYKDLMEFVNNAYKGNNVYPAKENLFKCFEYTDLASTKVVILGKLPFYRKDQADGLAYSTKTGSAMNQTTKVIVQEAVNDVGIKNADKGSFVPWAKQGVLLLNSIMTAPTDKPASHADCGWVEFTDGIIKQLNDDDRPKVFILWGEYAREKVALITNSKHLVLEAPNPSPLSAANGFYGSKPFSKTNEFLVNNGFEPINWEL